MSENAPADPVISDSAPVASPRRPGWCRVSVLTVALFALILLNNSEVLFRSRQYETNDYAANSLQVLKAKEFRETLGNYSRFGFHHPGPAFFYVFAWGEVAAFDATRLVPTPFNGQLMALQALSAFFFVATLALIASRLGAAGKWFVGLALLFAAWHFGAVGKFYEFIPGHFGLFCPWPPCFIVLPFLCFIMAAASVAASGGKDLPLMTLAGCFLVHGHVAMPLFVVPLALVAYAGLWRESRQPWKLFARQHWLAAATIALFLLPIAIDFFTAHPNNLERIVAHLRTSYGQRKGLLQSALYFLHFAAYAAYPGSLQIPALENFDAAGMLSFFLQHWRACGLWLIAICVLVLLTKKERAEPAVAGKIRHFRRRMYLILVVATALSLVWGSIQEGPMYYYNSLFNFAIYYGWLLVLAMTAAGWVQNRLSLWPARGHTAALIALALLTAGAFIHERRRFRTAAPDQAEQHHFAATVDQALILDPTQPKFLNFDWQAGGQTTRLALYLERHAIRWWVREDWPLLFGAERIIKPGRSDQPVPTLSSSFWRVSLHANSGTATAGNPTAIVLALTPEFDLVIYPGK